MEMSIGVTTGGWVDPALTLLDRPRSALRPNDRASAEAVLPLAPPGVGVKAKDPTPPLPLGVTALWLAIRWNETGDDMTDVMADITLVGFAIADAIASSGVGDDAGPPPVVDVGAVELPSTKKDTTLLLREGRSCVREDSGGGFC
eukprot:TRINITY_DN19967_c0_g1_i1.p2 TRINITY_DN19967_c0_g1~~TRINITY_DN19967_c0_g1_i1.p2  ORF type:complete len:145 (+),score=1.92 TRINITY_DN19967_c0_g1_i1:379-813(+)